MRPVVGLARLRMHGVSEGETLNREEVQALLQRLRLVAKTEEEQVPHTKAPW